MQPTGRPTRAEISLDALEHNFTQIKKQTGTTRKILTVIKANAYGHGAVSIAKTLEGLGVDFFGVATCEEAVELRQASITTPIIVLGGFFHGQGDYAHRFGLIPVVYNLESAEELSRCSSANNRTIPIHLKIDTGMGRLGILPSETRFFAQKLSQLKGIEVEGILSHLADTNQENHSGVEFTRRQIELFNQQVEELGKMGITPLYRHLANSAASIDELPKSFNLIRPGIMLYGSYPAKRFQQTIDLKPVMSLTTRIISLKKVPQGSSISYGRTFTCERDSLIAALPIGYADGYCRSLSNRGEVLIRGTKAHVVGVVCMDMVMIDVTDVPGVSLGDEVVLMGSQEGEVITAEDIAEKMSTISYEFLCGIGPRVPRVYIRDGKTITT
jgi:alanine racemase